MNNSTKRNLSFDTTKWSIDSKNTRRTTTLKRKLVEAGFYATPNSSKRDLCTCFACGLVLSDWDFSMDPMERHQETNPKCFFLSILFEAKAKSWSQESVDDRLASFPSDWNTFCPVASIDMAQGGFYYDPNEDALDNVTCASCHLSLQGWEVGDVPFSEHESRKPRCAFIKAHSENRPNHSNPAKVKNHMEFKSDINKSDMDKENDTIESIKQDTQEAPWTKLSLEYLSFPSITKDEMEMTVDDFINSRYEQELKHLESEYSKMIHIMEEWAKRIL